MDRDKTAQFWEVYVEHATAATATLDVSADLPSEANRIVILGMSGVSSGAAAATILTVGGVNKFQWYADFLFLQLDLVFKKADGDIVLTVTGTTATRALIWGYYL